MMLADSFTLSLMFIMTTFANCAFVSPQPEQLESRHNSASIIITQLFTTEIMDHLNMETRYSDHHHTMHSVSLAGCLLISATLCLVVLMMGQLDYNSMVGMEAVVWLQIPLSSVELTRQSRLGTRVNLIASGTPNCKNCSYTITVPNTAR